jgi:hypothetical protein
MCVPACVTLTPQGKGPSIDTAFAMFQRRRQIKQEMGHSVNVSVLDRIKLEKSKVESTSEAMRARAKQVGPLTFHGCTPPLPCMSRVGVRFRWRGRTRQC